MFRTPCARHHGVKFALHSLWLSSHWNEWSKITKIHKYEQIVVKFMCEFFGCDYFVLLTEMHGQQNVKIWKYFFFVASVRWNKRVTSLGLMAAVTHPKKNGSEDPSISVSSDSSFFSIFPEARKLDIWQLRSAVSSHVGVCRGSIRLLGRQSRCGGLQSRS